MIDEDKLERRATWAYAVFAGIVAATLWCAKLQFNVAELSTDAAAAQANAAHYRELRNEQMLHEEHRLTALETEMQCLKNKGDHHAS